jgi:hypothetical protein
MTDPEEKKKPAVQTRTPKKKTQGIFDNLRTLPHLHPVEEILGLSPGSDPTPSRGSTGSTGPTPSRGSTPSTDSTPPTASRRLNKKGAVAPERDYTKVANSIVRSAVPSGIFGEQGGKSKELYDTLYALTRGAIVPNRKIRIPKDQLMRKAGIGSEVTLRKNLVRLCAVGLIKESIVPGAHGGNEYEVYLPEEIGLTLPTPSRGSTPSNPRQMLEGLPPLDARGSRASLNQSDSAAYENPKTSFKTSTENDDDEAAATTLTRATKRLIKDVTGKDATPSELDKFAEVIDVIALEGKIAAARTTISSAGPFLAEHLRRRLFKKDKHQLAVESAQHEPAMASVDATACPDCSGVGWYYPEGKEKGMAKCKHVGLLQQSMQTEKGEEQGR